MQRFWALDRLRATAVLAMIQGHCFTAMLRPGELSGLAGRLHGLIHGLTGPAFLFGAGLAFGITTYPRYEQHRRVDSVFAQRVRRYALLVAIGYSLQLPGSSLLKAFEARGETLQILTRVGPLQLIALVLLLCQLAALLLRTAQLHALCTGLAGLVVMLATRSVYQSELSAQLGPGWGSYLDDRFASQYPIFPWASFALFGVASAPLLRHVARRGSRLVLGSLLVCALLYGALQAGLFDYDPLFWRTHPSFVLFRLALVLLLLGLLQRAGDLARRATHPVTAMLARHSLIAYVTHLLLLYGTPFTPSLAHHHGRSLSMAQCSAVSAAILLGTLAVVALWDWLQRERVATYRLVRAGLTLLGLVMLAR